MDAPLSLPQLDLNSLRIASPCSARWEHMSGDDRRRFCEDCGLHVHNLSAMTREEADAFVHAHADGGRLCIRMYKRADGTIITRDCPVGLARARAAARRLMRHIAVALGLVSLTGLVSAHLPGRTVSRLRCVAPVSWIIDLVRPAPPMTGKMLMGDVAWSPPQSVSITGRVVMPRNSPVPNPPPPQR